MADRTKTKHEYLILDIETVSDHAIWVRPDTPPGAAPMFPPVWAHRIVAIGCLWLGPSMEPKHIGLIGSGDAAPDESTLISQLFKFLTSERAMRVVTFNGRRFDLPALAMRAFRHGLPLPPRLTDGNIDVHAALLEMNGSQNVSLDTSAKLMGLPGKQGSNGKDVEALFASGNMAAIQHYCLRDVAQTALLLQRLMLVRGRVDLRTYRGRVGVLLKSFEADPRLATMLAAIDQNRLMVTPPTVCPTGGGELELAV
jgi:predicted PolB exonuclease-like 3'-5' exonuclease